MEFQTPLPYDPTVEEEMLLPFTVPDGFTYWASVNKADSASSDMIDRRTLVSVEGSHLTVRATFPGPGDYAVTIGASSRENPQKDWHTLGSFPAHVTRGTDRSFPVQYTTYQDEGWVIIAPLYSPLAKGSQVSFEIVPPHGSGLADKDVQVIMGGKWYPLTLGADGRFRGTVPATGSDLSIDVKKGTTYSGIVKYEIR